MAVSIARRNLFEGKTRFLISVGGVALAILLILTLDGVWAGSMKQVTTYMDNSPFEVIVAQEGVKNLHMTTSAFALSKLEEVKNVRGMKKIAPILYTTDYFKFGDNRNLAYVIGFNPDIGLGGPWVMAEGSSKIRKGEIIIDKQIANRDGIKLGDKVQVLGRDFKVGGLTRGTTSITNSITFIRFDDFERARRLQGIASFLLITLEPGQAPEQVVNRIERKVNNVTVLTKEDFAQGERKAISDMSTDIMRIMNLIGFLIGLAALGLSVYTTTLSKIKEYGVLKALGFKNINLYTIVFEQTIISIAFGFGVAVLVSLVISRALTLAGSNILLLILPSSVLKVMSGVLITGLLASAIPIQRISGVKPAEVFRH